MNSTLVHRVIARLNVGGPTMHVVNLTRAMNDGVWRTRLIAGEVEREEGDMAYYAEKSGVEVTYLPALSRSISPIDDLRTLWRLYRLFRADRPRVVHTHTAKAGTVGRLAAFLARVPVTVHTYHGHVLGGQYFSRWKTRFFLEVERQLGRFTRRLVVLTEDQRTEMVDTLGVAPARRFAVVPLGLDLEGFVTMDRVSERPAARRELGIDETAIVVGIVGRLVPIKNHELYLDVIRGMAGHPTAEAYVHGLVVGSGERDSALRERARTMGLHERVQWLGWRTDLAKLYSAMDVLVLTSSDEGTPVAILEALAAGTPVVARDVGGVAELLRTAGHGTLIPKDSTSEDWSEAVRTAWAAGEVPDRVRRNVADQFSVERLAADLARLYEAELASA